jgi:FAD/FMN-containing dehydrogenase
MGNAPSLRSLPGSALQSCLSNVFVANPAAVSYPQDFLYQQTAVKPYNADIYTVPVAVTRPSTSAEVAEIVRCAATSGVKVQARSGGHSYGNYCTVLSIPFPPCSINRIRPGVPEGAVVIDLVHFQKFEMNTTIWQATMGAGTLLGDVTKRLHDAGGRAMAHGTCPQVGIGGTSCRQHQEHGKRLILSAGHATIGGLGPISRLWGSALDHVREVEVVLADSRIVRASASTNPDIFFVSPPIIFSWHSLTPRAGLERSGRLLRRHH